jgi:predicted Ser/Thr protein kinase
MLRGGLVPEKFELDGVEYRLEKHLKADFFAATGQYVSAAGRRVCLKHFHTESWLGLPLGWAGRYMCRREMGFYRHLAGVEGVPGLVGQVGESGMVHEWVEGCDLLDFGRETEELKIKNAKLKINGEKQLRKNEETTSPSPYPPPRGRGEEETAPEEEKEEETASPGSTGGLKSNGKEHGSASRTVAPGEITVPDDFFERLEELVGRLHERGVAYVDLNKPDNVLVGEDGRPYLVDFQISYRCPAARWRVFGRSLFRQLATEDLYHIRKLKRKFRRDQMTAAEIERSYERSWVLSAHRKFAHPFQQVRRWVLTKLGAR